MIWCSFVECLSLWVPSPASSLPSFPHTLSLPGVSFLSPLARKTRFLGVFAACTLRLNPGNPEDGEPLPLPCGLRAGLLYRGRVFSSKPRAAVLIHWGDTLWCLPSRVGPGVLGCLNGASAYLRVCMCLCIVFYELPRHLAV